MSFRKGTEISKVRSSIWKHKHFYVIRSTAGAAADRQLNLLAERTLHGHTSGIPVLDGLKLVHKIIKFIYKQKNNHKVIDK